ncbi:YihY/virulence factor BrkB family protein [Parasphingorhabdus halotolerans]|uniref:YihY/virulence factor BrkB family protein n=1 Tax=Parasphingorhabdus halotolerans TaxID=2725558 RepID=A0A6H2DPW7_9SPHN|nr:YihY/virulence factor BrkB family protein [Parasphingorhabdus halotolerans]QJB70177.1 YihY/virulence factor BrkB family protein [Parasphingorhabdus halotolerans]
MSELRPEQDPADVEELIEALPDEAITLGATARTPLHFPAKAWWAIIKRVYVMNDFHNLPLLSAGVAFFGFLAFVPLIAVVVLLYGLIADPTNVGNVIENADGFLPEAVLTILRDQMLDIVTTSKAAQGLGLAFALLVSTYGAMRAATAMIKALNIIYEEPESRNILVTTFTALKITLGMALVAIVGLGSISVFSYVSIFLQDYLGNITVTLIKFATWLTAGFLVSVAFGLFFRYGPDRRPAKWRWLTIGSAVSTLLWLLITIGFGYYASNVSDYNATYGSLAAVVIFLMWLFLSAYAVLIGAEINAEMERQTFQDSTIGKDRPIGERGAYVADNLMLDQASKTILLKKQRRKADRRARKVTRDSL